MSVSSALQSTNTEKYSDNDFFCNFSFLRFFISKNVFKNKNESEINCVNYFEFYNDHKLSTLFLYYLFFFCSSSCIISFSFLLLRLFFHHSSLSLPVPPKLIFLDSTHTYAFKLDSNRVPIQCSEREKDVVRLRAYASVVWAPVALLPFLGGGVYKNHIFDENYYSWEGPYLTLSVCTPTPTLSLPLSVSLCLSHSLSHSLSYSTIHLICRVKCSILSS